MHFEKLEVWQRSARLSVEVYKYFAQSRDYGFKDQITRSSLSVPSNIAEGVERYSPKEKCHFIEIAKGSTAELMTQTYIGMEIGYIEREIGKQWINETQQLAAMLAGLLRAYQTRV